MSSRVLPAPDPDEERPSLVRREEREGKAPEGWKWTSGFEWEFVSKEVLRALLEAFGPEGVLELDKAREALATALEELEGGAELEPPEVEELEQSVHAHAAAAVFGPKLTYRGVARTADVLLGAWLDALDNEQLKEVTAAIQSGMSAKRKAQKLGTTSQRKAFLRGHKKTKNLLVNLQHSFDRAYQGSWLVLKLESAGTTPADYELIGRGANPAYEPYPHTEEAWRSLDRLQGEGPIRGLVALPTGAGKTDVAIGWLLKRLSEEPELRVLWLAHQISLLEQSALRFVAAAQQQPEGFQRQLRIFSSRHSPPSLLNPRKTDVACATIQMVSRGLGRRGRGRSRRKELRKFLEHPTIVVIDEAHHVTGPGYQTLLRDFVTDSHLHDVVGLTATPWGSSENKQNLIDQSFPQRVIDRSREGLIAAGVLADYKVIPVSTHVSIDVTAEERAAAERAKDLPQSVLRKLESPERNAAIVKAFLHPEGDEPWGRTLIFTTDTVNADKLHGSLKSAKVNVEVLHHRSGTTVASLKEWFTKDDDAVIVSVGMLLEGVDLPAARTAMLGRPTTNSNVLAQMVGRVLRGPAAGGKAVANVVYFQDDWEDFPGVLVPVEPGRGSERSDPDPARPSWTRPDVAAAVREALAAEIEQLQPESGGEDGKKTPPDERIDVLIEFEERRVVGYYEVLEERTVPVFDHQQLAITEYLEARLLDRAAELLWADDAPRPAVAPAHLDALDAYLEAHRRAPDFRPLALSVAPIAVAQSLNDATPRTRSQVLQTITEAYEDALAQATYPTLGHFHEAVEHWQRVLARGRRVEGALPENPDRPPLPRKPQRSLDRPWHLVQERMHLLPTSRRAKFVEPEIRWSGEVVSAYLAQWQRVTPMHHRITINSLLRTDEQHVSDEMLAYLLWHELIHLVTSGQGHDAEFYELEQRWPDAIELDADLDALASSWSCHPADYRPGSRRPRGRASSAKASTKR